MAIHPEVQSRAQAEIDAVVGNDRLPTMADKAALPYLHQVLLEVLRWGPPAPLALDHSNSKPMFYQGWFIPKGSTIVPNVW
jgi:cytochrome P450